MIESPENEAAVLGSIICDPGKIPAVKKHIGREDFYRPEHKALWDAILKAPKDAASLVPIWNELKGDVSMLYLVEVYESVCSGVSAEYHAEIVKEYSLKRQLASIGLRIKEFNGEPAAEQIAEIKSMLAEIKPKQTSVVKASECIESALEEIEKGDYGIKMGLVELDRLTGGLKPGNMVVIAGRPSMGKTALALNIASHVALNSRCVLIFSMEMTKTEVVQRLMYSQARQGRDGNIVDLARAAAEVGDWNILIAEESMLTADKIHSIASTCKPDLIIIDYLQLMWEPSADSRYQQVSLISRKIKMAAQVLGVPTILLSQLNRGPETRTNHRPLMSDLRDSGAIEQDADIVMLLYREAYYDDKCENDRAEIIVGKNRGGDTRFVKVAWHPEYVMFENIRTGEQ